MDSIVARTLIPLLALSLGLGSCRGEPALVRQAKKAALVHALQDELLRSVEAEKSAVMATTDEESAAFAEESRRRATELDRLREDLHRRVVEDGRTVELEKLAAFDVAWAELRDVDARLLALAVANSNLKAARLAAGDAAVAVDRLVDALAAVSARTSDAERLRKLSSASISALRIQTLLAPHIATADDGEMTRIEARTRTLSDEVEGVVDDAGSSEASAAWAEYQRLTAEVFRLSRLNTNVVSVDVSIHEKRRVTESCRTALSALLDAIESPLPATR